MRKRKIHVVSQSTASDCGAACLASLLLFYGVDISLDALRERLRLDPSGTSLEEIERVAGHYGLKCNIETDTDFAINTHSLPAIAAVEMPTRGGHLVLIEKMTQGFVWFMDPGRGELVKMKRSAFKKIWGGCWLWVERCVPTSRNSQNAAFGNSRIFLQTLVATNWKIVGAVSLIVGCLTAAAILQAFVVADMIDKLVNGGSQTFNWILCSVAAIVGSKAGLVYAHEWVVNGFSRKVDGTIANGVYRNLLKKRLEYFYAIQTGDVIERFSEIPRIRQLVAHALPSLVVHSTTLLVASCVIVYQWNPLFMIVIPSIGLVAWAQHRLTAKKVAQTTQLGLSAAAVESQISETVGSLTMIKTMRIEEVMAVRFHKIYKQFTAVKTEICISSAIGSTLSSLIVGVVSLAILALGRSEVAAGEISVGRLIAAYTLSQFVVTPISEILQQISTLKECLVVIDRSKELLINPDESSALSKRPEPKNKLHIYWNDAQKIYPSRLPLFPRSSFRLSQGDITLIEGPSGSGKSTALKLIAGLLRSDGGEILIGGKSIDEWEETSLRETLTYVPQIPDLITETICFNLTGGNTHEHHAEAYKACCAVGLSPWINSLPDGLDTVIGERGVSVSGGQRQRLGLARATYGPCKILLLDEPTASLDESAAREVIEFIESARNRGITFVVASHDLRIRKIANSVIVFGDQMIVERAVAA